MDQTKPHGKQPRQFTRDDCAWIAACTVNAVLEKLAIRQVATGIAVLPAGDDVLLVDVVMTDLSAEDTWAFSLTIPPSQEATGDSPDWSRTYEVLSISRFSLSILGFTNEQILSLNDGNMQAIADTLQENILHAAGLNFNEEVKFITSVLFTEGDTDIQTTGEVDG